MRYADMGRLQPMDTHFVIYGGRFVPPRVKLVRQNLLTTHSKSFQIHLFPGGETHGRGSAVVSGSLPWRPTRDPLVSFMNNILWSAWVDPAIILGVV